jgi:hypothetical protein
LGPATIDADKGYGTHDFVATCDERRSARCPGHRGSSRLGDRWPHDAPPGYGISQRIRERVEEIFAYSIVRMPRVAPAL